jgi:hypothetical protein
MVTAIAKEAGMRTSLMVRDPAGFADVFAQSHRS